MSKNKLFSYLALRETQLKNLSFILAVIINMLVIGSYDARPSVPGGSPGDIKVHFHALLLPFAVTYKRRFIGLLL